MTDSSLILVPASGRDSEASITIHRPGEAFVILKTVQSLSYPFLPLFDTLCRCIRKNFFNCVLIFYENSRNSNN